MIEIIDKSKCCGCSACASVCPQKCITMQPDEEGFLFPKVDTQKCVDCKLCERVCPFKKHSPVNNFKPIAFYGYNLDKMAQMSSSSGGIFCLIAEEVIKRGGVVFGAAFDENFDVKHIYVDNIDGIEKLRGSKYVQSEMGMCYQQAKHFLDNGRLVYFTGTPCQIDGLKKFLLKDYENLITQDFLCHGVPSPVVWNKYKNEQVLRFGSKLTQVSFRSKEKGWLDFGMKLTFENGESYFATHQRDAMFEAFLKNKCLRESCYTCEFRGVKRPSDITLADFWGANIVAPRKYDKNGTSIILLNSQKGRELFDAIKGNLFYRKLAISTIIVFNPWIIKSARRPLSRNKFMRSIIEGPCLLLSTPKPVKKVE